MHSIPQPWNINPFVLDFGSVCLHPRSKFRFTTLQSFVIKPTHQHEHPRGLNCAAAHYNCSSTAATSSGSRWYLGSWIPGPGF